MGNPENPFFGTPQELPPGSVDLNGLREAFLEPFRLKHVWKRHLQPEWVGNYETLRMRVFNEGYEPGAFFNYDRRYCLGLAVIRRRDVTHFLAEAHQPLPLSEPYRIAVRFTPSLGELLVLRPPAPRQLEIAEDNPDIENLLAIEDVEEMKLELEYLSHRMENVLTDTSKYLKKYREPQNKDGMRGANFTLPVFRRQAVRFVRSGSEARYMQWLIRSF